MVLKHNLIITSCSYKVLILDQTIVLHVVPIFTGTCPLTLWYADLNYYEEWILEFGIVIIIVTYRNSDYSYCSDG